MITRLRELAGSRSNQIQTKPDETEQGASRGQVLIMFALFLTVMMGILGLAVDLGYAFSQRRTVQNAADLAAVAGTRTVIRYKAGDSTAALTDVQNLVSANHMNNTVTELESCSYLDQNAVEVGDCSLTVPANATGVYVSVSETHPTFFIKVVPGAPAFVTTRADASAQTERLDLAGMDAPFVLCGYDTKYANRDVSPAEIDEMDILLSDYVVNPDALGKEFRLSGSSKNDISRSACNVSATDTYMNSWRGLADKVANEGKRIVLPGNSTANWWNPKIGSPATNVSTLINKVSGIEGCVELTNPKNIGTDNPSNECVMLLPVASNYDSSVRRFKVTKVMAFRVRKDTTNSSTFWGTLLDDYLVYGASVPRGIDLAPWCRDCGSVVVIRLDE